MKLLLLDTGEVGLDIAFAAQRAGHDVRFWIPRKKGGTEREMGKGIVPRVKEWEPSMKWADLILPTDNCFYIKALEDYFRRGFPIFGCNEEAGKLELDREAGQKLLSDSGLSVIPFQRFDSYGKAIDYVKASGGTYVSKPIGDADKGLSYVSKSAADMCFKLKRWGKLGTLKEGFILQECVKGTEMAVGGWFGPGGWSQWITENWEEKRLMNDGLGINTGEQGTTLRYTKKSKMFDDTLAPLTDHLFSINYVGYVDANCMVPKDGTPYVLELTMRFGWPLEMIQRALHKGDPIEWMVDLMEGKDSLKVEEKVAVGVVLSHGDYPNGWAAPGENSGFPITGAELGDKNVHWVDVMLGDAPVMKGKKVVDEETLVTSGNYVCVVTGVGDTVEAAQEKCYETIWGINLPNNRMFRTDISKRLEKELPELQKHGYAKGMRYA
jgi:phosphoribosylamine--glycine ligase